MSVLREIKYVFFLGIFQFGNFCLIQYVYASVFNLSDRRGSCELVTGTVLMPGTHCAFLINIIWKAVSTLYFNVYYPIGEKINSNYVYVLHTDVMVCWNKVSNGLSDFILFNVRWAVFGR